MFDYQKLIRRLSDFEKMGKNKQNRVIEDLMCDKEFAQFLFQPKDVPNLTEVVEQLYIGLSKIAVLKTIVKYIEEEGYDEFTRTQACFFYSIVSIALETANDMTKEASEKRKAGEISNREYNDRTERVEEYTKLIKRLFKSAKKIVKSEAKEIASESGLPYDLARIGCFMIPEKQYFDRHKIGRLLYLLLEEWYENIDEVESSMVSIKWKTVFKYLFGKENLAEVATYLLLEAHRRKDKFASKKKSEKLWDSLTEYALYQMNEAPEQVRDQMIELYLKKVSRMFTNGTYELRADLLSIPQMDGARSLSNLTSSILKYKDKLEEVLRRK